MRGNEGENQNNGNNAISIQYRSELYRAALSRNWEKAESIYRRSEMSYGAVITAKGETALHVSAFQGDAIFMRNLLQKMYENEIMIQTETRNVNGRGNTAFHCAVISGHVHIAQAITTRVNLDRLAMMRGEGDLLPIEMAALRGNEKMVRYLYEATKHHLQGSDQINSRDRLALLKALINAEIYDITFEMAAGLISRGIAPDKMEEELLEVLALKPLKPPGFLFRCFAFLSLSIRRYFLTYLSVLLLSMFSLSVFDESDLSYDNTAKLIQLLWDNVRIDEMRVRAFIESSGRNPIFEAAKHGNFGFLFILIDSCPDILSSTDENRYTIFHHAILNRHLDVFKLFHIGSFIKDVSNFINEEGNNILHLVAKLPPQNRLETVPGAVLQMQREILWFEKVKKIMAPHELTRKNHSQSYIQLRKMLPLIEEMKKVITEESGSFLLFENLKMVMDRYHVLGENTPSTTQLHDVLLLFEEMKMVMECQGMNHNKESSEKYTHPDSRLLRVASLFKEMKKVMEQQEMKPNSEPKESYTPRELFVKEHKDLMIEAKNWMKDTANSCMVVAALIATISFAAAITIPGGNDDDGYPQFIEKVLFQIFTVVNSISFLFSAVSLLTLLSTFTSKYTMDDFARSLPLTLAAGISALFLSTITTILAFALAIFIISKNNPTSVITYFTPIPILFFLWTNSAIFLELSRSAFASIIHYFLDGVYA